MDDDKVLALTRETAGAIERLLADLEQQTGQRVQQIFIAKQEVTSMHDRIHRYRRHVVIELQDPVGEGWGAAG